LLAAVRRPGPFVSLLVSEAAVAAFALFVHLRARVSVLAAFRAYETEIPALTRVALSPWLLPCALAVAAVASLAAVVLPLKRSRRFVLARVGLVVLSVAVVFSVLGAFAPIFRPD
jgi:hypothetical protein